MTPYSINPPTNEDRFEDLCLELLKQHWAKPQLQRFGKRGERQDGVDLLDLGGTEPLYAAQCKLKEASKALAPSEIQEEVNKAKSFQLPIGYYAILTTAKVSTSAQVTVREINQQHKAEGLFEVELFTWNRITDLLRQYPEVEKQFYGGLHHETATRLETKIEAIHRATEAISMSSTSDAVDRLIDEARDRINAHESQLAVLLLNRIEQTKGDVLTARQRFRVLTNLGAANLNLRNARAAAEYFFNASPLQPDDEIGKINMVLANHVLGRNEDAHKIASELLPQFPHSSRLLSLWIVTAPPEMSFEELEVASDVSLRGDAQVAAALGQVALRDAAVPPAIRYAEGALKDKPDWAQLHLLAAKAHLAEVISPGSDRLPLAPPERKRCLADSNRFAERAYHLAKADGDQYLAGEVRALQVDIAILDQRSEDAGRLAIESAGCCPSEPIGYIALAQVAFLEQRKDDGIRFLERAFSAGKPSLSFSFMLGQALLQRATDEDVNRTADVLSAVNLNGIPRHLAEPVLIAAVQAFTKAQRTAEADTYLSHYGPTVTPSLVHAVNAYMAVKKGDLASGDRLLTESVASLAEDENETVLDFLARNLMQVGRLIQALPLLQALFQSQFPNFDAGLLLDCASRLRRDDIVLKVCQTLFERGQRDWNILEFELQYLEQYDYSKAKLRLETFVAANPEHRIAVLRLAILTTRVMGRSTIQLMEDRLPSPQDLPPRYAVAAVQMLQANGEATLAVDYAYWVLRSHFSDLNAHEAFVASLNPAIRPDIPVEMESVRVGSAVLYAEGAATFCVVIEDTLTPSAEFEEIAASSSIGQELLGKRVGDTFILARSSIKDRVGTIQRILSKYARRFQVCMSQMQILFGDASPIQSFQVGSSGSPSQEDVQPILDSLKRRAEAVDSLRQAYADLPLSLHAYGQRFGGNAYDALLDLVTSDLDIRCTGGPAEEFSSAVGILQSKSTVIVELSALATIRLLGIEKQVLGTEGLRFAMSQTTSEALEQLRMESQKGPSGTMFFEGGRHYFVERSAEEAESYRIETWEWIERVKRNVSVLPAPLVADLPPEKRKELDGMLGRYGLEAITLAQSPGHVLWTDDLIVGVVASHEFGVERVWTQALVEHLANLGILSRGTADIASAKLIGFKFVTTHFNCRVMISAFETANWRLNSFPGKQMVAAFRQACANAPDISFRIFAEFTLLIYSQPLLPDTHCVAVRTLLDCFSEGAQTQKTLRNLLTQVHRLLVSNPMAQSDFQSCREAWERGNLVVL
jgi:tetratricopeptide (TPR) repeat protein